jgi:hypothetical protein
MNPLWLLRMSQWARRPPSLARIKLVFGIIAVLLVVFVLEHYGWWPDALTAERMRP